MPAKPGTMFIYIVLSPSHNIMDFEFLVELFELVLFKKFVQIEKMKVVLKVL